MSIPALIQPRAAPALATQPRLTVLIPVYNEERTVSTLLSRVLEGPYPDKQVIVIDDGSSDGTPNELSDWTGHPGLTLLRHERNQGKGAAVRTGLPYARGEATIIQDADLEYDPADYPRLIEPILRGDADAVYGSRYLVPQQALPWTKFRIAVVLLNLLVRLLYRRRITDEATCFKALRTNLWRSLDLQSTHFEMCAEVTAKLCRAKTPILEVPISYHPRGLAAGKKIGWGDGWEAVWTLLKWRIRRL